MNTPVASVVPTCCVGSSVGRRRHLALCGVALACLGGDAGKSAAQVPDRRGTPPPSVASDRAVMTAEDVLRHIKALTDDSMNVRSVPSSEVERVAHYVADQFEQYGLAPAGEFITSGGSGRRWFRRYPVPGRRRLDRRQSAVVLTTTIATRGKKVIVGDGTELEKKATAMFDGLAYFTTEAAVAPADGVGGYPVVLVAGPHTAASLPEKALRGAYVLYVPPTAAAPARQVAVLARLRAWSRGILVLSPLDSAAFAAQVRRAREHPPRIIDDYLLAESMAPSTASWIVEVWPAALANALAAAGGDLAELRTAPVPTVRPLPFTRVGLLVQADPGQSDTMTLPDVIGRLDGTDPQFEDDPIILSAHMDHRGHGLESADSAAGASREHGTASEVADLLVLAQALAKSGRPLRRPLVFLASSGGGAGPNDWGANFYIGTRRTFGSLEIAFDLALERLSDTDSEAVLVAGADDVELPQPPAWLLSAHPELELTMVKESVAGCPAEGCWSERSAFMRAGVPGLAFGSMAVPRGTRTTPPPWLAASMARAADREARMLRLVYTVIEQLGMMRERPRWTEAGRARLLGRPAP